MLYPVNAIESINIRLGNLSGPGWRLEGIGLQIHWTEEQNRLFSLSIDRIHYPQGPQVLRSVRIDCGQGVISDQQIRCDLGSAQVESPLLDDKGIPLRFNWQRDSGSLELHLEKLALAEGYAAVEASWNGNRWQAKVSASRLSLALLKQQAGLLGITTPEMELSGRIELDLFANGSLQGVDSVNWQVKFRETGFSEPSERYLAEGLSGHWKGRLRMEAGIVKGTQGLSLGAGAMLTPQFYLAPEDKPVSLEMPFRFTPSTDKLELERLVYRHPDVLEFSADGVFGLAEGPVVSKLHLQTRPIDLEKLYQAYLTPVLTAPFFEQLTLRGQLVAALTMDPEPGVHLELSQVGLMQGNGAQAQNIEFHGLRGDLFWGQAARSADSVLSWQGGRLFRGVEIGAAQALLELTDRGVRLRQPLRLPVMDGFLQAESFELEAGDSGPRLAFRGFLTPISMEKVSRAAGWPVLAGELSGVIPGIAYQEEMLQIDGIMRISAFDGRILIRDLRLDDLFGPLPILAADIEFKGLDLETLTRTFSFGKITGKLEGRVDGLRLENWFPVAFDARFATPEDDRSRHRISQKAVDNISNLGGVGMSGALSRSFLRFFEEFGYDRIGISCRLENGICEMGGVGPAANGYYLVRGGGIPRIDIVGFNRSTDWNVLIGKLKQIAAGGSPIVE